MDHRALLNRARVDQVVADGRQREYWTSPRDAVSSNGEHNITGDLNGFVFKADKLLGSTIGVIVQRGGSSTDKLVVHFESQYFEAPERAVGSCFDLIMHLLDDLGHAIPSLRSMVTLLTAK